MIYETTLPFPPSVNKITRAYKGRAIKSKSYREWEKNCPDLILPEDGSIDWPVHIVYEFFMPDKRKRDIGNFEKAVTDQLVKQCVLFDDNCQIVKSIELKFIAVDRDNPRVEISIFNLKENVVPI